MKLSIIIVNYNVTHFLRKCLSSIERFCDVTYETIVVDNASPDASWKELANEFPKVKFIESEANQGFAVANNTAVKEAKGEYILLLNPDTELQGFYLNEIIAFADAENKFGCLGVRLYDAENHFLPESKRSVPNMINSFGKLFISFRKAQTKSYYRNDIGEFDVARVEVVTGAFLLCRKKVYGEVGGLDEAYFMYGEDIDLCYTFLQKGYLNWYYGKASVLHHKGESTVKDEAYLKRFYGAMQIFVNKYYKKQVLQRYVLSIGLKLRYCIEKMKLK